ncbi:MAG: hypothetical protein ACOC1D_03080 [Prolixibacteraceae bacterium]
MFIYFFSLHPVQGYFASCGSKYEGTLNGNATYNRYLIAGDEKSVSTFFDWFFQLPCYRLRYSNNEMAVQKIQKLIESL